MWCGRHPVAGNTEKLLTCMCSLTDRTKHCSGFTLITIYNETLINTNQKLFYSFCNSLIFSVIKLTFFIFHCWDSLIFLQLASDWKYFFQKAKEITGWQKNNVLWKKSTKVGDNFLYSENDGMLRDA